ncbi:unnamed protein product [Albugo candida]|uniref:Uncharacterized protein n=1 Tax=Albugo candida TaxID=65357 RepID=A0A024G4A4_9STRA|nr:unnamed protein product [Albugo candida]|eukprot:CCI41486.1 unnamed protein product [Albugo candida]
MPSYKKIALITCANFALNEYTLATYAADSSYQITKSVGQKDTPSQSPLIQTNNGLNPKNGHKQIPPQPTKKHFRQLTFFGGGGDGAGGGYGGAGAGAGGGAGASAGAGAGAATGAGTGLGLNLVSKVLSLGTSAIDTKSSNTKVDLGGFPKSILGSIIPDKGSIDQTTPPSSEAMKQSSRHT